MRNDIVEAAAKKAFLHMVQKHLLHVGIDPDGDLTWEGQKEEVREDWRAIVGEAIADECDECARIIDFMGSSEYVGDGKPADAEEIVAAIRVRKCHIRDCLRDPCQGKMA